MRILFPVDEAYPLYKIGGLGDVGSALPKALRSLGHDIRIILPGHPEVDRTNCKKLVQFQMKYGDGTLDIDIEETLLPGTEVIVYIVSEAQFISKSSDASDNDVDKFSIYSAAVVEWLVHHSPDWQPEIIHLNDWHTGLIPYIAKQKYPEKQYRFLLTIHNLAYQGSSDKTIFEKLSLEIPTNVPKVNPMATGLVYSDVVSPVSPNYAKEILTPEYGEGFDSLLLGMQDKITGVLNGLDIDVFNPASDKNLEAHYDATSFIAGKAKNKVVLQKRLRLSVSSHLPLIGYVGRIDAHQKGVQLIIEAIKQKKFPPQQYQFAFLGVGDKVLERQLTAAVSSKKNISLSISYNEKLASQIYAASDLMVIPSKFEPCGLVQLIAMRYGALPIVRSTGGLKDTVNHEVDGFVFDEYSAAAMVESVNKAVAHIEDELVKKRMIQSAMRRDFSWTASAIKYLGLYNRVL